MDTVQISARPRHLAGSDVANKVRRAGLLPGVLYGKAFGNRAIALETQPVKKGLQSAYGRNQIFSVAFEGDNYLALAREVQVHPLTRQLQHVDLHVLQADTRMVVTLPVTLSGRSVGQKAGGRLVHVSRYIKVACTPETLPTGVNIDVTPFENGTVMTIETLPLPEGVKPVFKKSFKIFEIIAPKVEEKPAEDPKAKKK